MSHWCRGDIQTCRRLARRWSVEDIAKRIGKPVEEIVERFPEVQEPKLKRETRKPDKSWERFTEAEIQYIKTRRAAGVTITELASEMGRSNSSIQSVGRRQSLAPFKVGPPLTEDNRHDSGRLQRVDDRPGAGRL